MAPPSPDPAIATAIRTLTVVDNDTASLIAGAINLVGRSVTYRRGKANYTIQDVYDLFTVLQITIGDHEPVPGFLKEPRVPADITAPLK